MSNYVYDGTALPNNKVDATAPSGPANKQIVSAEWNTVMQALDDLRGAVLSGDYHGIRETSSSISAAGQVKLRLKGSRLQASENGNAYRGVLNSEANVLDFGADPTGIADSGPAFKSAIESFNHPDGSSGGTVVVPFGKYRIANGINVKRSVWIKGVQTHGFYLGCQIIPDPGVTPFTTERYNTPVGTVDSGSGEFTLFSNLQFENLSHKVANWSTSHSFSSGAVTRTGTGAGEDWRRHYKCTQSGVSASSGNGPRSLGNDKILNYQSQAHNFVKDTYVTGTTSGATGIIIAATNSGPTGTLRLTSVGGTFINGENLSDGNQVMAVANGGSTAAVDDELDGSCRWKFIGSGSYIRMRGRASIRDCGFAYASGNAVHIEAQDLETVGLFANANGWLVDHCTIYLSDGHGLFVNGSDTNGGNCTNCDFGANGSPGANGDAGDEDFTGIGYNVYESSFLGNAYFGCQFASGGLGSIHSDNVGGGSTFLGCYQEGTGGGENDISGSAIIIGGGLAQSTMTVGSSPATIGPATTGRGVGMTVFGYGNVNTWRASVHVFVGQRKINGPNLYQCITAGITAASVGPTGTNPDIVDNTAHWAFVHATTLNGLVTLGSVDPQYKTFLYMQAPDDINVGLGTYYRQDNFVGITNAQGFIYGISGTAFNDSGTGLMHAVNDTTLTEWPYHVPTGRALFEMVWIGGCRHWKGTALPAAGTFNPGDTMEYKGTACVAGGAVGQKCVTAGTFGTYGLGRTATSTGGQTLTVSGAAMSTLYDQHDFRTGDKLTINGVTARVQSVTLDGLTMVMDAVIPAGAGLTITYSPPVFKEFGLIASTQTLVSASAISAGAIIASQYDVAHPGRNGALADADGGTTLVAPVGVAATAVAAVDLSFEVQDRGMVSVADALWTGGVPAITDVGKIAYLSTTPGLWTLTAPTASGASVVPMGIVTVGGSGAVVVRLNIGYGQVNP